MSVSSNYPSLIPSMSYEVNPPSLINSRTLLFFAFNFCTLGIYASFEVLSKKHHIKQLKVVKKDLKQQSKSFIDQLDKYANTILKELKNIKTDEAYYNRDKITEKIGRVKSDKQQAQFQMIPSIEAKTNLTDLATGLITFTGQLIFNFLSLGVYGVYQNYNLKKRIYSLKTKNQLFEYEFKKNMEIKSELLDLNIQLLEKYIESFDFILNGSQSGKSIQDFALKKKLEEAHLKIKEYEKTIEELKSKNNELINKLQLITNIANNSESVS